MHNALFQALNAKNNNIRLSTNDLSSSYSNNNNNNNNNISSSISFNSPLTKNNIVEADYNGPKLYKRITGKSNKLTIINSLNQLVLAGTVNTQLRKQVTDVRYLMKLFSHLYIVINCRLLS